MTMIPPEVRALRSTDPGEYKRLAGRLYRATSEGAAKTKERYERKKLELAAIRARRDAHIDREDS